MPKTSLDTCSTGLGRVAVVHSSPSDAAEGSGEDEPPSSYEADAEVLDTAGAVADALRRLGADVWTVPLRDDPHDTLRTLRGLDIDRVFNLVEAIGDDPRREPEFAALLEEARIPYTGSPATALDLGLRKDAARRLLDVFRIPVAPGFEIWDATKIPEHGLEYPLFVKPARADGSIGIDQGSVVYDRQALARRVAWLLRHLPPPCLVETYLPGPEINVALIPDRPRRRLVPTMIDFSGYPPGHKPIVTYDCKWIEDSCEYVACSVPAGDSLPEALIEAAVRFANAAFLVLDCASYGRADFRVDEDGIPRIIDINPNPDLHPDAGLARAGQMVGLNYETIIARVAEDASLKECHVRAPDRSRGPRAARLIAAAY